MSRQRKKSGACPPAAGSEGLRPGAELPGFESGYQGLEPMPKAPAGLVDRIFNKAMQLRAPERLH